MHFVGAMADEGDLNPYAPPIKSGPGEPPPSGGGPQTFELASLGKRFGGAMIDGLSSIVLVNVVRRILGGLIVPLLEGLPDPAAHVLQRFNLLAFVLPLGVMG